MSLSLSSSTCPNSHYETLAIQTMNNTSGMFEIVPCTFAGDSSAAIADECITDMDDSVRAIEQLLNYRFNDKKLLEAVLTHPSYTDSPSYQRLEFVGDAALGLAISDSIFLAYPDLRPGQLSLLRSANISTEKLARAAVKHGLYKYVRHNAAPLDEKVRDFTLAVQQEADTVVHGGMVKAPKVLADIVEAVAAAVYADPQFDLQAFWVRVSKCLSSTGEEGRSTSPAFTWMGNLLPRRPLSRGKMPSGMQKGRFGEVVSL
ncbi:unnamed protein product [Camellia sinensis]